MPIVIYHKNNKVVEVDSGDNLVGFSKKGIAHNLFLAADQFSDEFIIWCHLDLKPNLNLTKIEEIFHHKKIMASYELSSDSFLPDTIGYVDESLFLNVKKNISYPTWRMSGDVGGIHASVLKQVKKIIKADFDFDYFLHSLAKLAMMKGLFCYSQPLLIKDFSNLLPRNKKNNTLVFRFVKQHYRTRWVFILFLNLVLYEKKVAFLPLLSSLFFRKRSLNQNLFDNTFGESGKTVYDKKNIDVIIPTIGRKKYLYDVLKDLSMQTHLPENIIIIEQNPDLNSVSELDYLYKEKWPFHIKHTFTRQAGACNARNLALEEVKSEWIFMADDDIRIQPDFLDKAFKVAEKEGFEQLTFGCYIPDYSESKKEQQIIQWDSFGSGCSIVKAKNLKNISYNKGFEFGYGEDSDFGAQLRDSGFDILYSPKPEIMHLKAPLGGFRTKPVLAWAKDSLQPKPSPTVMLYKKLHLTKQQLNGYKTVLFFKFYRVQEIKNPRIYFFKFQEQWKASLRWADELKK